MLAELQRKTFADCARSLLLEGLQAAVTALQPEPRTSHTGRKRLSQALRAGQPLEQVRRAGRLAPAWEDALDRLAQRLGAASAQSTAPWPLSVIHSTVRRSKAHEDALLEAFASGDSVAFKDALLRAVGVRLPEVNVAPDSGTEVAAVLFDLVATIGDLVMNERMRVELAAREDDEMGAARRYAEHAMRRKRFYERIKGGSGSEVKAGAVPDEPPSPSEAGGSSEMRPRRPVPSPPESSPR